MWVRLIAVLVALAAVVALYFTAALKWSFSTGERAGWVQKFSKKGWICKTWEGELSMVAMPGAMPEKFQFTTFDDAVAEQITRAMGKRVNLHYEEKVGLPTTCFGETRHYVTGVTVTDESPIGGARAPAQPQPQPQALPAPGALPPTAAPAPATPAPMPAPSAAPAASR